MYRDSTATDQDFAFLRQASVGDLVGAGTADLSVIDLFSGCGGLSLGALEGARRSGRSAEIALAIDWEEAPLQVLRSTLGLDERRARRLDLETLLRPVGSEPSAEELDVFGSLRNASLLLAGPPCQGHSALNNHTRHDDPRNDLYVGVARTAELVEPDAIVIENVRGVGNDRRSSVARCSDALGELGYHVTSTRVDLSTIGVPQRRIRHLLVAVKAGDFEWPTGTGPQRDVAWAIEDLLEVEGTTEFDTPAAASVDNQARMDWLVSENEHNLPNPMRPRCHQSDHSYISMYGRLWWDAPAQTITSGFGSMGQGRFVHPKRPRTLTPHEAARLQFLPDFVRFDEVRGRGQLAQMIGNVAPPALAIWVVSALIEQGLL